MSRELTLKVTNVFERNLSAYNEYDPDGKHKYRYFINMGGSGSSKTTSLMQMIILLCIQKKTVVTIVRDSLPLVRKAIEEPWVRMMEEYGLYESKLHYMTLHYYTFRNKSRIEFMGVEDEQKVRGMSRDILWVNECNELDPKQFAQLSIRTDGVIFLDFNPTTDSGWYYNLISDPKAILIHSTYLDNRFAAEGRKAELENLKNTDPSYYNSLVLGNRATKTTRIYNHFKKCTELPQDPDDEAFGLDIGYNHPSALIHVAWKDDKLYVEELLYERGLTNKELIERINLLINKSFPVYVDSAQPAIIEELNQNGFNAQKSDKKVVEGINKIKSSEVYITLESENLWKEYQLYSWKCNGDIISDTDVVKYNDDCLDALRYCINTHVEDSSSSEIKWYFGNKS